MSVAQLISRLLVSSVSRTQKEKSNTFLPFMAAGGESLSPLLSWLALRHLQGKRERQSEAECVTEQQALREEPRKYVQELPGHSARRANTARAGRARGEEIKR